MHPLSRDELLDYAHQRLYPSLQNPNYLVLKARREIFRKWIARLPQESLRVLDVGGRYQPYRPLFEGRKLRYVACDLRSTELVDVVGNAEALPFAAGSFDVVISTQVFEYVSRPDRGASEIHRVLKVGGTLLMSVCALAPRFGDDERWRYTPLGIRQLLDPFSRVTIVPETSSIGGILRTMNLAVHGFANFRALRKLAEFTVCPCLNLAGSAMEKLKLSSSDQFTPNYSILAVK